MLFRSNPEQGAFNPPCRLELHYVDGLRSLLTLSDLKLDELPFSEGFETIALDRAIVNEYVPTSLFFNKAVSFGVIKPLDLPCWHADYLPAHLTYLSGDKRARCFSFLTRAHKQATN